jgi:hypothetical protein
MAVSSARSDSAPRDFPKVRRGPRTAPTKPPCAYTSLTTPVLAPNAFASLFWTHVVTIPSPLK